MKTPKLKQGVMAGFAAAHGSAQVIVYCGRHYGRAHAILSDNGRVLVAVHLPTGDVIHAPHCDCERIAPNEKLSV